MPPSRAAALPAVHSKMLVNSSSRPSLQAEPAERRSGYLRNPSTRPVAAARARGLPKVTAASLLEKETPYFSNSDATFILMSAFNPQTNLFYDRFFFFQKLLSNWRSTFFS